MAIAAAPRLTEPARFPAASRDTGIDLVRALCVLGVVLLHAIMVGVEVTASGPVFDNASDGTAWIAPLSWLLQVMPLFFVIGGFSGLLAYRRMRRRGGTATGFVAGRINRLLRPAIVTVAIMGLLLALLTVAGVPADLIATAGFRYSQPLWFLGVFLLCQALLPVFTAAHERAPYLTLGGLVAAAVAVDGLRAAIGVDGVGFLNLAFVWMALQQLGFFLADGRIDALSRRARAAAGAGALALLVLSFTTGVHSPDLIANINPPTTALLLVGVIHTALLSLYRERLTRLSGTAPVAAFTAFVTARTMTIYLWHMPVLLVMAGVVAVFGLATGIAPPLIDSADWWAQRPLWLATALALTAAVSIAFARLESRPTPATTTSTHRVTLGSLSALSGVVLLLVVGTTVATAAIAVALFAAALALVAERAATAPAMMAVAA